MNKKAETKRDKKDVVVVCVCVCVFRWLRCSVEGRQCIRMVQVRNVNSTGGEKCMKCMGWQIHTRSLWAHLSVRFCLWISFFLSLCVYFVCSFARQLQCVRRKCTRQDEKCTKNVRKINTGGEREEFSCVFGCISSTWLNLSFCRMLCPYRFNDFRLQRRRSLWANEWMDEWMCVKCSKVRVHELFSNETFFQFTFFLFFHFSAVTQTKAPTEILRNEDRKKNTKKKQQPSFLFLFTHFIEKNSFENTHKWKLDT